MPIEVKTKKGRTKSLKTVLENNDNFKYGIKFTNQNIGFDGKILTIPYFLIYLFDEFLKENTFLI